MKLLFLPLLLLTEAAIPHIGMIYQETKQEESLREPDLCKPQFISEPNLLKELTTGVQLLTNTCVYA